MLTIGVNTMAVTRIKNNQITDGTIEAGKIANTTITGGKLANNLTYGSNLTISGNLTVNGTTTTVDTTNTVIADPLMLLSRGATGAASVDAGLIVERGDDDNVAFIWDESDDKWVAAITSAEDGTTAGNVTIDSYANLKVGSIETTSGVDITGDLDVDNLNLNGNTIISTDTNGDINLTPNGTGEVVASTLAVSDLTDNRVVIAGTSGALEGDANFTYDGTDLTVNSAIVSDLTDNRIVVAGTSGALEDDANLTWDGSDMGVTGGLNVTGDLAVDNIAINGNTISSTDTNGDINLTPDGTGEVVAASMTVSDLTDNQIVVAGTGGILEGGAGLTWDGTDLTTSSIEVADLTDNRVLIAGASGAIEDDANFTFDGTSLALTAGMDITGDLDVDNININGNTIISTDTNGNISLTPNGTGEVVMSTATVSDLTANRIVVAGTSGALEDDANLTWDGSTLTASGDVSSTTLQTSGEATLASAIVSDLTDNRVVIAGSSGALEDDGNFTFDGTALALTAAMDITGDLDVDNININGNAITSTDTNGNITITPNGDGVVVIDGLNWPIADGTSGYVLTTNGSGQLSWSNSGTNVVDDTTPQLGGDLDVNGFKIISARSNEDIEIDPAGTGEVVLSTAVVSDLTDNRVVIAGASGALEDDANFTFDGTTMAITAAVDVTGDLDVDNLNLNGNTISSTDTNGAVNVTPNGTGTIELGGTSTVVNINGTTGSTGSGNGALVVDGGVGIAENLEVGGNIVVAGNLTVEGTTTTVDSVTTQVVDPIFQIGGGAGGAALTSSDAKDRGMSAKYYDGAEKTAFWGFDDSTGFWTFVPDATISSEVVSGSKGTIDAGNIRSTNLTDNRVVIAGANGVLEDDANFTYDGTDLSVNSAIVTDLTDNRVVIVGTSGALEDDANFTYDGTDLTVNSAIVSDLTATRVTYAGASGALVDSANMTFDGTDLTVASAVVSDLTNNRIVVAGTSGALEDDANLTWDGSDMGVTGGLNVTGDLAVDNIAINGNTISSTDTNGAINLTPNGTGEVVAASATVSDLTSGRIVTAGTSGALEDSASLTWDGTDLTAGSAIISDLTDNRVVIAGTSGALEDDANFTWDGSTLTVGGDVSSTTLQTSGEATLASAIVSDLTDNRVVIAGTSGALEDDANFTFNGTTLALTAAMDITGDLDVDNININGNTIISTDTNGDVNITPNGTGEVVASTLTVSDLTDNRLVVVGTSGALEDDANLTWSGTALAVTGGVDVTGDLDVDNININGNTIISTDTNGDVNITPNGTGETVIATAAVSDLTSGRIVTAGTSGALEDSASLLWDGTDLTAGSAIVSDLTAGRVVLAGTSGAIEDSGNLTFDGTTLTVTGNIAVDNITLDGNDITATSGGKVTVNDAGADVDFTVEGDTDTALLHVDAGTDTVNIGTATATTGAKVKISSTDSMIIPTGSTAQRPGTGVEGMLRINSSTYKMEYYANSEWKTADSAFTVIASETFDGDDSTVAFTLSDSQTTASCIVAINGVLQLPVTAYGVSGTTLTFTEAPATGDKIEVRKLTTTTTITDIASADSYQAVQATDATGVQISTGSSAQNLRWTFDTSGHLIPNGDELFDIGDASNKVRSLYVGGGTVYLGDLQLKDNGDNTLGVFQSDGTTPAGTVVNDFVTGAQGDVRFMDADSSNFVAFQAPATVSSNVTWTLPDADASVSGYALVSDASGTLSWAAAGATISQDETTNTNFNLYFASTTSGALTSVNYDTGLSYNPSTGTLNVEDLVLSGDLTVNGTTTTVATTNTVVSDNLMELNNGAASNANDSGIVIERGSTGDNAFMGWDESADKFIVGTTTATGASTGDLTIATGTLVANLEGNVTGAVTGNADTATTATNVTATANNTTNETTYITFVDGATGAQGIETDTGLTYNPSTNTLTTSVFSGTATTAQYADLAEMYASDTEIEAGTVVHFAGNGKVAPCDVDMCSKVAGIVSTDPAHLMNSSQEGTPLALAGRVPCKVVGPVNAGDLMVSAGNGMARAEADPKLGTVIGKAIEDFSGEGEGVIEVLALMM